MPTRENADGAKRSIPVAKCVKPGNAPLAHARQHFTPKQLLRQGTLIHSRGMNWRVAVLGLVVAFLCCSCGRSGKGAVPISGPPQSGAIYSMNDGEGGFRIGKVLAVEEEIVFMNLYSERWTSRPSLEAARKAKTSAGLAFSAQSFSGMQPVHLEPGNVSPEELEAYEDWKQSKRAVF